MTGPSLACSCCHSSTELAKRILCPCTLQALSKETQLSRVERWAESGPEDSQVAGELKEFWSEVKKRLAEAHKTLMVLALHKVSLHHIKL
jgi:predicted amidophosphoribosyltransferase